MESSILTNQIILDPSQCLKNPLLAVRVRRRVSIIAICVVSQGKCFLVDLFILYLYKKHGVFIISSTVGVYQRDHHVIADLTSIC